MKPEKICLIGIQPQSLDIGLQMTPLIRGKLEGLVGVVIAKLRAWGTHVSCHPPELVRIDKLAGTVETGITREIALVLLPEEVKAGHYVVVHAGFAIQKLNEEAAQETLSLLREISEAIAALPDP